MIMNKKRLIGSILTTGKYPLLLIFWLMET